MRSSRREKSRAPSVDSGTDDKPLLEIWRERKRLQNAAEEALRTQVATWEEEERPRLDARVEALDGARLAARSAHAAAVRAAAAASAAVEGASVSASRRRRVAHLWRRAARFEGRASALSRACDACKWERYFPAAKGYRWSVGANGVYAGAQDAWLSEVSGDVHVDFIPGWRGAADVKSTVRPRLSLRVDRLVASFRMEGLRLRIDESAAELRSPGADPSDAAGIGSRLGRAASRGFGLGTPGVSFAELGVELETRGKVALEYIAEPMGVVEEEEEEAGVGGGSDSGSEDGKERRGRWVVVEEGGFVLEVEKFRIEPHKAAAAIVERAARFLVERALPSVARRALARIMPVEIGEALLRDLPSLDEVDRLEEAAGAQKTEQDSRNVRSGTTAARPGGMGDGAFQSLVSALVAAGRVRRSASEEAALRGGVSVSFRVASAPREVLRANLDMAEGRGAPPQVGTLPSIQPALRAVGGSEAEAAGAAAELLGLSAEQARNVVLIQKEAAKRWLGRESKGVLRTTHDLIQWAKRYLDLADRAESQRRVTWADESDDASDDDHDAEDAAALLAEDPNLHASLKPPWPKPGSRARALVRVWQNLFDRVPGPRISARRLFRRALALARKPVLIEVRVPRLRIDAAAEPLMELGMGLAVDAVETAQRAVEAEAQLHREARRRRGRGTSEADDVALLVARIAADKARKQALEAQDEEQKTAFEAQNRPEKSPEKSSQAHDTSKPYATLKKPLEEPPRFIGDNEQQQNDETTKPYPKDASTTTARHPASKLETREPSASILHDATAIRRQSLVSFVIAGDSSTGPRLKRRESTVEKETGGSAPSGKGADLMVEEDSGPRRRKSRVRSGSQQTPEVTVIGPRGPRSFSTETAKSSSTLLSSSNSEHTKTHTKDPAKEKAGSSTAELHLLQTVDEEERASTPSESQVRPGSAMSVGSIESSIGRESVVVESAVGALGVLMREAAANRKRRVAAALAVAAANAERNHVVESEDDVNGAAAMAAIAEARANAVPPPPSLGERRALLLAGRVVARETFVEVARRIRDLSMRMRVDLNGGNAATLEFVTRGMVMRTASGASLPPIPLQPEANPPGSQWTLIKPRTDGRFDVEMSLTGKEGEGHIAGATDSNVKAPDSSEEEPEVEDDDDGADPHRRPRRPTVTGVLFPSSRGAPLQPVVTIGLLGVAVSVDLDPRKLAQGLLQNVLNSSSTSQQSSQPTSSSSSSNLPAPPTSPGPVSADSAAGALTLDSHRTGYAPSPGARARGPVRRVPQGGASQSSMQLTSSGSAFSRGPKSRRRAENETSDFRRPTNEAAHAARTRAALEAVRGGPTPLRAFQGNIAPGAYGTPRPGVSDPHGDPVESKTLTSELFSHPRGGPGFPHPGVSIATAPWAHVTVAAEEGRFTIHLANVMARLPLLTRDLLRRALALERGRAPVEPVSRQAISRLEKPQLSSPTSTTLPTTPSTKHKSSSSPPTTSSFHRPAYSDRSSSPLDRSLLLPPPPVEITWTVPDAIPSCFEGVRMTGPDGGPGDWARALLVDAAYRPPLPIAPLWRAMLDPADGKLGTSNSGISVTRGEQLRRHLRRISLRAAASIRIHVETRAMPNADSLAGARARLHPGAKRFGLRSLTRVVVEHGQDGPTTTEHQRRHTAHGSDPENLPLQFSVEASLDALIDDFLAVLAAAEAHAEVHD